MADKPMLIAMMGLPRSGKSTIARKLAEDLGCPIVSRDAIRLSLSDQRYVSALEPLVKTLDVYFIRALFLAGHDVVICDETNYSKAARNHLQDPEWETAFYQVKTEPDICKARAITTDQPDLVPVIDEMFGRYEPLQPSEMSYMGLSDRGTIYTSTPTYEKQSS